VLRSGGRVREFGAGYSAEEAVRVALERLSARKQAASGS
jgi:hypothetical protein